MQGMPRNRTGDPIPLPELIARLQELDAARGIERARLARRGNLAAIAQKTIANAGDEGMWQAKRGGMSYKEIMAEMGYTDDGPVGRAITDHNRRVESALVRHSRAGETAQ